MLFNLYLLLEEILINIILIFNRMLCSNVLLNIFFIRIRKCSKQFKKKNKSNIKIFKNSLLIKKLLQSHYGFYRIIFVEKTL